MELEALVRCVGAGSGRIIMVLGPPNSGKSTMLKQFESFVKKKKTVYALRLFGSTSLSGVDEVLTVIEASSNKEKEIVVIVDSAEELARFPVEEEAKQMVDRFKTIARDKKATVIMSTYWDLFREDWIGSDVEVIYVGHLSRARAKAFFCNVLAGKTGWWQWLFGGFVSNKDWEQIYQVCGGSVYLLEGAARALLKGREALEEELSSLVASTTSFVLKGFLGGSKKQWEGGDFRKLAELMSESGEAGAVEWSVACERLFGSDEHKLKAMQGEYVIHVQYAPAPPGRDGFAKFVMPLSPPHLQAMKNALVDEDSCM